MSNAVGMKRGTAGSRMLAVVFVAFLCIGIIAGVQIFTRWREYYASDKEYERLRHLYSPFEVSAGGHTSVAGLASTDSPDADGQAALHNPTKVNPDYVGWLQISGTTISYPVVQTGDNEKYLYKL